jgi:hypothetical protein
MVIAIVVGAVALVFFGFATYPFAGYSNAGNDNVEGCRAAKANLVAKHSQTCGQPVAVATARANMVAAGTLYAAALGASIALAAVAAVAGSIPIVGPIIAAAAALASSLAAAYSLFLLGRYAAACSEYAIQSKGLEEAMKLEDAATKLVNDSCAADDAAATIAALIPCPV